MQTFNRTFERPAKEWNEKFANIATPIIGDVMGRQNIMDFRIRPIWSGARCVGPALTVMTYPSDNLMIHLGVSLAQEGDILVVDAGNYPNAGLWGEILTINAMYRNIGGLIIDGGVRDIKEIEELGFPMFASGINARGGYKSNPGRVNMPVSCGGVAVCPGDLIVADENGVAVIPKADIAEVYEKCLAKISAEQKIMEQLRQGKDTVEIMNMEKELDKLGILVK
ncbi:4-carboxy-4-hydroxy-2-oxoadipate aldolase/oxaloacetate decarboxylase [Neobacillus drentensis]|uniref:4-carboxy-4-hydroxy-2-oxoadipate aldolase/oxaloacetate decarboxylase n=1 Tax=Neobacillus drentensis TaxID=220684 RepID=UPI001F184705|nr:4-carboxy-4-hydroxy-2-oxoadipate aldolase/oxaloacetate decarboxylase [Neobacillus drentensis]ULT58252.1 4-carboxy-4-hydroxy-2-oxoadipate aldolase/oxaloacetate decarboxylase [Neobacillus drentensis]